MRDETVCPTIKRQHDMHRNMNDRKQNGFILRLLHINIEHTSTSNAFGHIIPSIPAHASIYVLHKQALTGEVSNIDEVDMSDGDEDMADEIDNTTLASEARPREASSSGDGGGDGGGSTGVVPQGQGRGKGRSSSSEREHDR